jgi:hypothetical protein
MTSQPLPLCSLVNPDHPLVDGAPRNCDRCGAALCLRKQVINLALGFVDQMFCLGCLGKDNQTPAELLESLRDYIDGRECFAKQWIRYSSVEYCPDQTGCIPHQCFK